MYSVSVIMPVYNNEQTLEAAIESILNQTIYDFELILINDGSTDQSAQICEAYAKKEPLIIEVFHQEQLGRGQALNKGLFNSSGNYIYFADPTDLFDHRLLQANVQMAKEKEADVVVFGFRSLVDEETSSFKYHLPRMPILSDKENFRNHYRNFHHFYPYSLHNKLFKRTYFMENRLRFPHLSLLEDAFFNLSVFRELESVAFNRGIYCYRNIVEKNAEASYNKQLYNLHFHLAQYLEEMIRYWHAEEEYADLIGEAYFEAVQAEIENLKKLDCPMTDEEKVNRLSDLLEDYNLQDGLQKLQHVMKKDPYKNALLHHMLVKNGKALLELVTYKEETKKVTTKLRGFIRKIFNSN